MYLRMNMPKMFAHGQLSTICRLPAVGVGFPENMLRSPRSRLWLANRLADRYASLESRLKRLQLGIGSWTGTGMCLVNQQHLSVQRRQQVHKLQIFWESLKVYLKSYGAIMQTDQPPFHFVPKRKKKNKIKMSKQTKQHQIDSSTVCQFFSSSARQVVSWPACKLG